jgi:murein DD-endopeptidase MepM/ murein hydrolase activator NlpD
MKRVVFALALVLAARQARADEPTIGARLASASHDAVEMIAKVVPAPIPDITMLTTQPIPETLSSGYGWRDDPIRHTWRFHSGTDFPADYGTPVLAAGAGKVIFAGRYSGYGNCVQIDHGNGVVTLYGHMQRILVKQDAVIAAGDRIGLVGSTGRATGPHLHFEIRLDHRPVDPVAAMTIAQEWRDSPVTGRIAACRLTPERQKHLRAYSDRRDGHPKGPRPERAARAPQPQVLW